MKEINRFTHLLLVLNRKNNESIRLCSDGFFYAINLEGLGESAFQEFKGAAYTQNGL